MDRAHNAPTFAELEADPRYKIFYDQALASPKPRTVIRRPFLGGQIYNSGRMPTMFAASGGGPARKLRHRHPAMETVLDLMRFDGGEGQLGMEGRKLLAPSRTPLPDRTVRCGEDAVTVRDST